MQTVKNVLTAAIPVALGVALGFVIYEKGFKKLFKIA